MEKQKIIIRALLIFLIISGIGNIYLLNYEPPGEPYCGCVDFVVGTSSGPATLELVDSWDRASNTILYQVVETLFSYDLYDLDLPRNNKLAYSYWWENSTILHIHLREGILFHDGTPFNADAAKWNLDRLQFLTNNTGANHKAVAHTQSLWRMPDGITPIMDSILSNGLYNITIYLNSPYAPLLNTLAYINAGMISPTAHAGDETSFIDLTTGDVIGTGPFMYDRFVPNVEVRLSRWDKYWRKPASFETVVIAIYSDETTNGNALLSKTIDMTTGFDPSFIPSFESDPRITVKHFTEDTGKPSLVYQYLGINNKKYNVTWRKVFSYAINYTYVIEDLREGNVVRAHSPISPGYGASYNSSLRGPDYNITIARETMQSMGFGIGYTTDAEWVAHAESTGGKSPFISVVNQYNTGNTFREDMFVELSYWFKLIGVEILDPNDGWSEFLNYLFDDYDKLGVFAIGWGPDYLDPYNIIDPLFNPLSSSNSAQVNDSKLNEMMELALETTNDNERTDIYKNIQWYMSNRGYFHAPLYYSKITYVHLANIYNIPYNAMQRFELYGIYRSLFPM